MTLKDGVSHCNMKKRLLILGGTSISRQIVYAARELNMEVYVTDYLSDSPCKLLADKSFMVSCTDVNAVVQLIQQEHIDGVIVGYADVLLPYYVQICEKAGLPCYANMRAIQETIDKAKFKALCRKFDVPVVPEYSYEDVLNNKVQYPLLVKPVDNSGARGIYICKNKREFDLNYTKALSYSRLKEVLIERYISAPEATIFYYLHNGEIYLLGIGDRHMLRYSNDLLPLPISYTFPATQQLAFLNKEDGDVKRMFRSLGMREGMVFMQSFVENGQFVIYEMGYRLTGSIEQHLMEHAYGFNHLKEILNFAVGNKVDVSPLNKEYLNKSVFANVTLLLSKGTIDHYEGIDDCNNLPYVLHIHNSYKEGKIIDENTMGKLAQVGIRVLLFADNKTQLLERMDTVKDMLHVISTNGEEMILKNYFYKEICR